MFKQEANQSKPKASYSAGSEDEIEEIKRSLFSEFEKFSREKISQEDLDDFCDNLLEIIQNQARELADLYFSQFEPPQSARNINSNFNFNQRPPINIFIPAPQYFGQFASQMASPYAQPLYEMRPNSNSIFPNYNSCPNCQIQPMPNMHPYNNPYVLSSNPYAFGTNMLSNSISTQLKKAKKSKSSKSEHKKKGKAKEKVVEKRHEHPKRKPKSAWSNKKHESAPNFPASGSIRQFPYNAQNFGTSSSQNADGILRSLCRGISPSSSNSPVFIDSSSKFVTGYGYPRNVLPGGSYFQAANDDDDFWIRFDFRERSVKLSDYYIDSDNIKNWEIQISDDGIEWETIDSHSDYSTTNVKTAFNVESSRFARFIRLHQTGEISSGSRSSLKINTIEFFGQLMDK